METSESRRNDLHTVLRYHERTKHHLRRYAQSLGYLDWATQPHPFRSYEGTQRVGLPFVRGDAQIPFAALYETAGRDPVDVTCSSVGALLELSLAISAWKSAGGSPWALRINPSSGNLHPTEAYTIVPPLGEEPAGVFHYNPYLHVLERRAAMTTDAWSAVEGHFGAKGILLALASIPWREAWKYGERAFRYCQLDVGHALAAIRFSAALLGWRVIYLSGVPDESLRAVLGFDRTRWSAHEEEHAECVCWITAPRVEGFPPGLPDTLIAQCRSAVFAGEPNTLSTAHVHWSAIDEVIRATAAGGGRESAVPCVTAPLRKTVDDVSASTVIRRRRSGVRYDGRTSISRDDLLSILDKTLPRSAPPFDAAVIDACTNLLVFVHRVKDVEPGLYFFHRENRGLDDLRRTTRKSFSWKRVEDSFPLYQLATGSVEELATRVSCHQPIAGESAISLGMVSNFRPAIKGDPHAYRRLFWEAGMIGQVLYLEAEARGLRGTGIGCFFDDEVHRVLGLADDAFQCLYQFAIGGPVEDSRVQTWPPYVHLETGPDAERPGRSG